MCNVFPDVLEKLAASIFRVPEYGSGGCSTDWEEEASVL
jgi:hypothetical protein